MVVLRATLPLAIAALAIFIMKNEAVLQRKPNMQKLPTFDAGNPGWGCKHLEEDQRVGEARRIYYCNLHIQNTLNLLKRLLNPSISAPSKSDQDMMPSMPKRVVESKQEEAEIGTNRPDNVMPRTVDGARLELEVCRTLRGKSGALYEQDGDNKVQDQDQQQQEFKREKVEEKHKEEEDLFGRQSGAHFVQDQIQEQEQEQHQHEYKRKKVGEKQGKEEPFQRQSGASFLQDQDQDKEHGRKDLEKVEGRNQGMADWRKKMLRRMG